MENHVISLSSSSPSYSSTSKASKHPVASYHPISIDNERFEGGALAILAAIQPNWSPLSVKFKLLTDGITNKLISCTNINEKDKNGGDETILIRIYGNKTDLLIDRTAEIRNILFLGKFKMAPKLYATFTNGLAYEFIPGTTLNECTVRNVEIYTLVAKKLATLHKVMHEKGDETAPSSSTKVEPILWTKIWKFLDLVPAEFSDRRKQDKFKTLRISTSNLNEEIHQLYGKLTQLQSPVVFAHNDLLLGNIIYTDDTKSVNFIDYEYAGPNYQAFDIGNHFAEFAGVENADYANFPPESLQKHWLSIYLEEFLGSGVGVEVVDTLYRHVNKFVLVSHLFWGIWALIQAEHSNIDFDFIGYAKARFEEYFARKDEFLSL